MSRCCVDKGTTGMQCWKKNDGWAECWTNETCKPGVHPGETHGWYDQYGKFRLDEWSCEKLGERSKATCDTFDSEDDCPDDHCEWFFTKKCLPKCARFRSKESCPASHCVWDGAACMVDTCSAPGEDCTHTKCCSAGRGAAGQQCFKKMKWWATCMDFCDGNTTNKGWSCEKLGERKSIPAPCSWAGDDCSKTRCCGNIGFSCVVKDDTYTGCVQTAQHGTWIDMPVKLPEGWEGTVVGRWAKEYQVAPALDGAPVTGGSMFCFMAILPNSTEVGLMEVAKNTGQGVFACNESMVLHSWKSSSAGWDTGAATLVNTGVFFKIWDQVREDGRYLRHDWTVKADADCAWFPDRLRSHLAGLRVPAGAAVYIKNTDLDAGLSNGQFLGALEIFSKKAMLTYYDNAEGCQKSMGANSGEDGFFKGCLDALGVGFMHDGSILKPDYASSYCNHEEHVSFHPLKDPAVLQACYDFAMGKPMDWAHNTAPGAPI